MALSRLIYFSENRIDAKTTSIISELSDILSASNHNNEPKGISGALIFDSNWFLQVLEGDAVEVHSTFDKIRRDRRHHHTVVVEDVVVEERQFGNWWMGYASRNPATAAAFAPYLRDGTLQPPSMTSGDIMALMRAVASVGLSRDVVKAA